MKRAVLTFVGIMAVVVALIFAVSSSRSTTASSRTNGTIPPVATTTSSGIKASTYTAPPPPPCAALAELGNQEIAARQASHDASEAKREAEKKYNDGLIEYSVYLAAKKESDAADSKWMSLSFDYTVEDVPAGCTALDDAHHRIDDARSRLSFSSEAEKPAAQAELDAARAEWDRLAAEAGA